jgi:chaperonin GroES
MKITPINDRVVVRRFDKETKTPSGIYISTKAVEKSSQGQVIAVGQGKILDNGTLKPMSVKAGDKVLFGQYAGSTVKIDNEEFLVMSESEIFGIMEGEQP